MENKTAERYKALKTGGETWNVYDGQRGCSILRTLSPNASYNKSTVDEVVSLLNASLQCAEMKKENERLKLLMIKIRDYDYWHLQHHGISALIADLSKEINDTINKP